MDNIEKYIKDNLDKFNDGQLPQGHKDTFMKKLEKAKESNVHHLSFTRIIRYTSVAVAAIVIGFIIKNITLSTTENNKIEVINYAQIIHDQEAEILNLAKETDPNTFDEIKSTMEIITRETIPLSEQLPGELSEKERIKILREYYKQKSEALRSLKLLYAQEINPIE